ncbi:MAG: (5-formylfuran-3-yl)methyl phosphate synthase [Thauera sp.]
MRMLVSVRDVTEAREALRAGVDFIDLKEPSAGALGGLALPVIREVVAALRGGGAAQAGGPAHAPLISATIGDLPPDAPEIILERARAVGACGVDLVKVGVPGRGAAACAALEALAVLPLAIVPVLIADDGLDAAVIDAACAPAFAAVMADTQAKRAGSLLELLGTDALAAFIDRAHAAGRMVGLAGALRVADLPQLARLGPDFAGFRSAVCDGSRAGRLDPRRLEALRAAIAMTPTDAPAQSRRAADALAM